MTITKQVHALRQALLNWYPFGKGENALLCGTDIDVLKPLLTPWFGRVRTAGPSDLAGVLRDREKRYDLIAAFDLVEVTKDAEVLLRALSERLADDGTLLLGFRNRFGLKYFCGGLDAFTQTPFETIAPMSGEILPRYYGKEEMRQILRRAGLSAARWYYLMPDADFVQAVYTDDGLPTGSIRDRVFTFDPYHSPFVAAESQLLDDVVREGTLPYVANYYLVEAKRAEAVPAGQAEGSVSAEERSAARRRQVSYAALSTDRGRANGFATVLYDDGTAEKTALWPEGIPTLRRLFENGEALRRRGIATVDQRFETDRIRMPRITEEASLDYLKRQLPDNPAAFLELFSMIREDVLRSSEPGRLTEEEALRVWGVSAARLGPVLRTAYIDMIPYNAFWTGDGLRYYDQEFTVENCPARYVLFRALLYTWYHLPEMEAVLPLAEMKQKFGLGELWDAFKAREERFVRENRREEELAQLYEWRGIDAGAIARRREALAKSAEKEREEALAAGEAEGRGDALLDRVHAVQLRLLKEFDRVCRENGLRYFAAHGTLLGAVRHEGFIPWDDDVDLAMPREDYDRFTALAPEALGEGFFFQTPESDPACFYGGYGKLRDSRSAAFETQNRGHACHQGIWIDIFPLDSVPRDAGQREKLQQKICRVQRLLFAKTYRIREDVLSDLGDGRIGFFYLARRFFHADGLRKRLHRLCAGRRRTGLRSIIACYYYKGAVNKTLVSDEDLSNVVELPFEDMKVCAPANYGEWLTQRYGAQYMALPRAEKRTRRKNVEFHPDIPYTSFKAAGSRYSGGSNGSE